MMQADSKIFCARARKAALLLSASCIFYSHSVALADDGEEAKSIYDKLANIAGVDGSNASKIYTSSNPQSSTGLPVPSLPQQTQTLGNLGSLNTAGSNAAGQTGGQILIGNTDAPPATPISQNTLDETTSGDLAAAVPPDCDPAVLKLLLKANKESIERQFELRERPAPGKINEYDCFDAIANVRIKGFFNFPSPMDVFNKILKAVCNKARDEITNVMDEQLQISTPGITLPGGVYVEGSRAGIGGNAGGTAPSGTGGGVSVGSAGTWNDQRFSFQASKPVTSVSVQTGKNGK